jgi:hypothetical protein
MMERHTFRAITQKRGRPARIASPGPANGVSKGHVKDTNLPSATIWGVTVGTGRPATLTT